jgi:hypothetical protein
MATLITLIRKGASSMHITQAPNSINALAMTRRTSVWTAGTPLMLILTTRQPNVKDALQRILLTPIGWMALPVRIVMQELSNGTRISTVSREKFGWFQHGDISHYNWKIF